MASSDFIIRHFKQPLVSHLLGQDLAFTTCTKSSPGVTANRTRQVVHESLVPTILDGARHVTHTQKLLTLH